MIPEAIVLAGGLGTRLKPVVSGLPKSLAPVAGRPFLAYLLDHSLKQGLSKFIFALGFRSEQIMDFVKTYLPAGTYSFSTEEEPLGTGGAVFQACALTTSENLIVLNADTFFGVSLEALSDLQMKRISTGMAWWKPAKTRLLPVSGKKNSGSLGLLTEAYMRCMQPPSDKRNFPGCFPSKRIFLKRNFRGKKNWGSYQMPILSILAFRKIMNGRRRN
jgi:molybdopterin-guanine dinucleotide biosynthesis protein A